MNKKVVLVSLVFVVLFSVSFASWHEPISERITKIHHDNRQVTITDRYVNWFNTDTSQWERVDMTLKPDTSGTADYYAQGIYKAYFFDDASQNSYIFEKGEHQLTISLQSIQGINGMQLSNAMTTSNFATYQLNDYSFLSFIAQEYRVKEFIKFDRDDLPKNINQDIVLKHKISKTKELNIIEENGQVGFYDGDELVMFFPEPFAYDKNNNMIWLDAEIKQSGQNTFYEVIVPQDFLNSAEFPIYIDPTTNIAQAKGLVTEDTYIASGNPDTNYGTEDELYLASSSNYLSYLEIDLNELDVGICGITNATLHAYLEFKMGNDAYGIAYYCNDNFDEDTLTWNNVGTEISHCNSTEVETEFFGAGIIDEFILYDFTEKANADEDGVFTIKFRGSSSDSAYFSSRDNGDTNKVPFFNLTYSECNFTTNATDENTGSIIDCINVSVTNGTHSYEVNGVKNFGMNCNVTGDLTIIVRDCDGNYAPRYYYVNNYTCGDIVDFDAYLLDYLDGCYMDLNVKNNLNVGVADAYLSVYRNYAGVPTLVAEGKTGSTGSAPIFLSDEVVYDIDTDWNGISGTELNEQLTCGKEYNIFINIGGLTLMDKIFGKVSYWYNPHMRYIQCANDTNLEFGVYDMDCNLTEWGVNVTCWDENDTFVSTLNFTNSSNGCGGEIYPTFNTTNCSSICMNMFINKTGYPFWDKDICYDVKCYTSGLFSLSNIFDNGGDLGLDDNVLSLIALLVMGVILMTISRYVSIGDVGAGVIGLFILGIFTFYEWFIWEYYLLVVFGFIGYVMWRGLTR